MNPLISIVIPVYNEEESLPHLFERLDRLEANNPDYRWEFVLVNDGSRDRSEAILRDRTNERKNYAVIHLSKNFGHQNAVTAGMDFARGDAVAIIDADLQDPPEVIAEMLPLWQQGYGIVYGKRRSRSGEGFLKKFTSKVFYRTLAKLTNTDIPLDTGDFRLMDRKVVDVVSSMRESHRFIRGIVAWTGFRSIPLLYDRQSRVAGKTKYPVRKLIRFASDAIFSFSDLPLRFASYLGLMATFIGFVGLIAVVSLRLFTDLMVPAASTLLATIIFFGGVQLSILGIIGAYVGRTFTESKGRPLYIAKELNNIEPKISRREPLKLSHVNT